MVCEDGRVLLGMKKRGFGAGRWNGFGGKVEPGESVYDAAVREVIEESGVTPTGIKKIGNIIFSFENDPKLLEVHVFKATGHTGEPVETEEMRPQWFAYGAVPYDQMWSDDEYWIPLLFADKPFRAKFHFDQPSNAEYSAKILKSDIQEVESLS